MKIIDAVWEQRNLGIDSVEIYLDDEDTPEMVRDAIEQMKDKKDLRTFIVPSTQSFKITGMIEDAGYHFVHSILNVIFDTAENAGKMDYLRECSNKLYAKKVEGSGIDRVCAKIEEGIFTDERFNIDPRIGIDKTNRRYSLWIRDLYEKAQNGNEKSYSVYEAYNVEDDQPIGFLSLYNFGYGQKTPKFHLIGKYLNMPYMGKGHQIQAFKIVMTVESGATEFYTGFSSHNLRSTVIHQKNGWRITSINNFFAKMD